MKQLHRSADKLSTDTTHLSHLIDPLGDDPSPEQIELALSVAKRVRRESTILVRLLASLRDQLHA
jgi:hypothetical protein